jgi:hypothetical protein
VPKQFERQGLAPVRSFARIAATGLLAAGVALASTLFAGNLFSAPAFADDRPNPSASPSFKGSDGSDGDRHFGVVPTPGARPSHAPDDGDTDHHQELYDKYGNDVDKVFLPPLVVKGSKLPPKPLQGASTTIVNGQSTNGLKNATQVDPAANPPINPNVSDVTDKTPADKFFQAATFGLGIMGVGAVALFTALIIQRRRHSAENH